MSEYVDLGSGIAFSGEAGEVIEQWDPDIEEDVHLLRTEAESASSLLAMALDSCDECDRQGWEDYVAAIEREALRRCSAERCKFGVVKRTYGIIEVSMCEISLDE